MVWTGTCRSWCKSMSLTLDLSINVVHAPSSHVAVKRGAAGNVTALWPGSSLHYMQVLAESRWEDYEWESEGERYAYWGQGISWIESPELDPLGIEEQDAWRTTTTIPRKDSDLSFYLWKSPPLPRSCIPPFQKSKSRVQTRADEDVAVAKKATSYAEQAVALNGVVNGDSVNRAPVNGALVGAEEKQRRGITVPV